MLTVHDLSDKSQTGAEMYDLVNRFSSDLDHFEIGGYRLSQLPLDVYHQAIRNIPYRKDGHGVEVVTRPYLLFDVPWRGWDCKKKAIAMASYLKENGIPYRFAAVSRRPAGDIHHVIPQAQIDGNWVDMDPTYGWNRPYQDGGWTNVEILSGESPTSLPISPVLVSMYGDGAPSAYMAREFAAEVRRMAPEQMGAAGTSAIIAAIIGAVATVTTTIVAAVSAKNNQERLEASQRAQREYIETSQAAAIEREKIRIAEEQAKIEEQLKKWGVPVAIGGTALLLFTQLS